MRVLAVFAMLVALLVGSMSKIPEPSMVDRSTIEALAEFLSRDTWQVQETLMFPGKKILVRIIAQGNNYRFIEVPSSHRCWYQFQQLEIGEFVKFRFQRSGYTLNVSDNVQVGWFLCPVPSRNQFNPRRTPPFTST